MQFTVFALSSVPDTTTTRQLFGLDDLDDKSVSKVLFHRRKQQTGSSEKLRWDQRAIASLSLIQHAGNNVQLDSRSLAGCSEEDMLRALFKAVSGGGRIVSWDGVESGIPLLHFRTLKHAISYPAYWHALRSDPNRHMDIRDWLSPPSGDRPTLDETARKLGYPGMIGRTEHSVMEAWLQGDYREIQAYSDFAALNTYLLALRIFETSGELASGNLAQMKAKLMDGVVKDDNEHLKAFVAAWSRT